MDCRTARDMILEGAVDAEVEDHLQTCEACSELAADDARLARALGETARPTPLNADDLMASIEEEARSPRGRLRALPTWQRLTLLFVAAIAVGVIFFVGSRRPDWAVYPMPRMMLFALSMLAATAIGVLLALPRYFRPRTTALMRGVGLLFLVAVAFLPALFPEAHSLHPASEGAHDGFWEGLVKCAGLGTLAALPVVILAWALKRNDGLEWWSTLAIALVAAVGANLALQMHCPVVDPMHILMSHSALTFVYAVVAWVLVRISR